MLNLRPRPLNPRKRTPVAIGGWVGPRTCLDNLEEFLYYLRDVRKMVQNEVICIKRTTHNGVVPFDVLADITALSSKCHTRECFRLTDCFSSGILSV